MRTRPRPSAKILPTLSNWHNQALEILVLPIGDWWGVELHLRYPLNEVNPHPQNRLKGA